MVAAELKRGQLLSVELVLACSFFILALFCFAALWSWMYQSYLEAEEDYAMRTVLLGISDSLVLSPGEPSGWNLFSGYANSYGLASSQNVLSDGKALALQNLNSSYDAVKERMGAGAFEVYVGIYNESKTIYQFGKLADANNSLVSALSTERLAILNGSAVSVKVQVWRIRGRVL
ncbi:MAG: hypothetical protein N3E51_05155 [Candidatus Micrarchaeota archaeon]|nr:hypothetical protein [Candidatus Micrarchaeota archaeon]